MAQPSLPQTQQPWLSLFVLQTIYIFSVILKIDVLFPWKKVLPHFPKREASITLFLYPLISHPLTLATTHTTSVVLKLKAQIIVEVN